MRAILLLPVIGGIALGQDWSEAAALRPADTSAQSRAVLDELEGRARAALAGITRSATKAEVESARTGLREKLQASLGHRRLPWPPDLQSRTTGVLQRDGYRIEKIVFQTLPGVWAAAHLYLPDKARLPAPGVLFYNGHWWPDSKSRPDFQAFCINMARMGFAVFNFDPFGQGERGVSSRDHRRTEALLVGVSQQGIAEYETQCALDYLLSRKEVDRDRIGMTGASGGGYNTWITAALDDRIKVAVPVVGTSDFLEQIEVTRDLDWYRAAEHCHFVPSLIRFANNHELLAMVAPRPLLIVAAAVDQSFPVTGVRGVHNYGERLYESFGAAGNAALFVDEKEGHGYQKAKREAAYGWFARWLMGKGDGRPIAEPETRTIPFDAMELKSFPDERRAPAGPGILEIVKRMAREATPSGAAIEQVMGGEPRAVPLTVVLNEKRVQRRVFTTQPGIDVPALVLRAAGKTPAGVLVAVDDGGKEELVSDPIVRDAWRRGWDVWAIDPRGIGESAIDKPGWVFAVSLLLGENFVWRQGWDIRRVLESIPANRIGLYARGHNAALAATYAAAMSKGKAPEWAVLRGGFLSWKQFLDRPGSEQASFRLLDDDVRDERRTAFDREIPHEYFVFDGLRSGDLPELLAAARTTTTLIEPLNGDWKTMPIAAARALAPPPLRVMTVEQFLQAEW